MWLRTSAYVVLAGAALAVVVAGVGGRRWRAATEQLVADLRGAVRAPSPPAYDEARDLEGLPVVVAGYFRRVLTDGQPLVTTARIAQAGDFRQQPSEGAWQPFESVQTFSASPPGFVWDARIRMAPGLDVRVRDAYVGGRGSMYAAVFGTFAVADAAGTPEMAAGSLLRYLAEAVWMPTALLPRMGVAWAPVDERSARATLADGATRVSLDFRFDGDGDIVSSFTPDRPREAGGTFEPTPWGGRYGAYERHHGMRVPMTGEVAWWPDGDRFVYWRGRLVRVDYDTSSASPRK